MLVAILSFQSTTSFDSQIGGSIFGGTSTPTFGTSSTPVFGSSTPAFGSSVIGQKPAFGGFGSTPSQTSPFGSNLFGFSAPFSGSSEPAFGATSTPAFGAATTPALGGTGMTLGVSSAPEFGSGVAFDTSSTPSFGSSSTLHLVLQVPAFGASSTPSFSFGCTPVFGQTMLAFGSNPFGTSLSSSPSSSPFGAHTYTFGDQATAPTFGSTGLCLSIFGGQCGGSRVASYTPTPEVDGGSNTQPAGKLESISAMPIYKDKSHEELRGEDYQLREKGGPNPYSESTSGFGFGACAAQSSLFAPLPTFGQSSTNIFSSSSSSHPFASKTPTFGSSGFGDQATTPTFGNSGLCLSIFGGQCGGSKVASYTPTPEVEDGSNTQPAGKLESISAMPIYKDKSHEELRGEDYQLREKGGPNPYSESTSGFGFGARAAQSSPFGPSPTFGQLSTNQFSNSSSDPFASKTPAFGSSGFGNQATASTFGSTGLCLSTFGGQCGGSRVASYTPTPEVDGGSDTQPVGKLESISAMPIYKDKSHEELRGEDYQLREKGDKTTAHTFGSTGLCLPIFGGQCGGSKVVSYTPTPEVVDCRDTQPTGKLESISAMAIYKDKSHEELRVEDYQLREKGGPNRYSESTSGFGFGARAAQSCPFGPSPTFGQLSTNQFSSSSSSDPFTLKTPVFGSSGFGDQASALSFGSTGLCLSIFRGQCRGSRVASYTPTPEVDGGSDTQPAGKLESISAMAIYKDKSHEELRWEDYQLREKGGPNPYNESISGFGFGVRAAQSGPVCPSPTFGHSSTNQFSTSSSDPFASKTLAFGSSGFGALSTHAFGSSSFGSSS